MASQTRERWLEEGLAALSAEGVDGLKIDRIASRLGLSKGSFHHHFRGAPDYRSALLQHYEERSVAALADTVSRYRNESAQAVLGHLTEMVGSEDAGLYDPRLDLAVRAWATHDHGARDVVARIDAARLAELESLWARIDGQDDVSASALLPYLVHLGATVLFPNPSGEQLRDVYRILLRLAPHGEDAVPPT